MVPKKMFLETNAKSVRDTGYPGRRSEPVMRLRGQRGFSLIELLIVVFIILIIASVSVPGFLRARISANQSSAVASVRQINTAEGTYASSWGSGYAPALTNLGSPACFVRTAAAACLLDRS